MKIYRKPIANGVYYKASTQELKTQIKKLFLDKKFGPGFEPEGKKTDESKAFVMPHNNYEKSGYCAAHAYKKIFENTDYETIVIIGPDHDNFGCTASIFPKGAFITPFGEAEIDEEFNELLLKEKIFTPDEFNHSDEYSIEVQLPFLQYYYKENMPKIVPILINSIPENKELEKTAKGLHNAWMKSGKRTLFIASTNFSHVGLKYGYIPFSARGKELNEKIKKLDNSVAQKICKLNAKSALKIKKKHKMNICGMNSIIVLIHLLSLMKSKKISGKILSHYSSADLTKDYNNFIDYFAIEFS
ncbi:MAG: AmmeMemoRadiSam system protein B [Candidatus Nanoarchaeia archaeon]|nr:AmmeMemoRadiSam system protein B [Candidatus Nanoarchaeia archaeon]MDD5499565.1 AmmeMemoRadiSam system protein B [Candidatus Nanoarchaeia archaeon]